MIALAPPAQAAPVSGTVSVSRHSTVISQLRQAANYYAPTIPIGATPRNGWSWATYLDGDLQLYRTAGDQKYLDQAMAWGRANNWSLTTSQADPDSIKAGQAYYDLNKLDPSVPLSAMDTRMSSNLAGQPLSAYWWIDALYMGLPDWARWATRTANPAYLDRMDALFNAVKTSGQTTVVTCTGTGLYDATEHLWYRDCRYVGTRDPDGKKIFWGRGNGWVIAAMAEVLQALPAGDARATKYRDMLVGMADRLRGLQGSDGMWRTSLLNPTRYPVPETSATALITYAMAYGVNAGILDRATYLPVIAKAWNGLTTISLQPSGFLTDCQNVGYEPGTPYTGAAPRTAPTSTSPGTLNADSPPFCAGAFLLAGSELARLTHAMSTGRPVTASAQQTGNEATRAVDGDVTTRWSASGFPQTLTVDLGSVHRASNAQVMTQLDRAYRYRIQTSMDGSTWTTVVDRTANTTPGTLLDNFSTGTIGLRYARLTVTGIADNSTTWVSIREFAVHDRYHPRPDLAYARPATATSSTSGHAASAGVDASTGTYWAAAAVPTSTAPQQLTVDLQSARSIDTVRVFAHAGAGPRAVSVQTSTDGSTWTTIATATLADSAGPHMFVVPVTQARWVRLRTTSSYGTAGPRVDEFEVYG
jgi:rhamnogalacturonyl hydrolase YesR